MKSVTGLQQLGYYKTTKIQIDWDYLLKDRGLRKEVDDVEHSLGLTMRIITLAALAFMIIFDFLSGKFLLLEALNPDRLIETLFWINLALITYSEYLLRDRTEYFDTLEVKKIDNLRSLEKLNRLPQEIELCDYFDYDILNIFDDLLRGTGNEFLIELVSRLHALPKVQSMLSRVGITDDNYSNILIKIKLELNPSVDNWVTKILFESFTLAYKYGFETVDERVVLLYLFLEPLKDVLIEYKILPNEIEGLLLWAQNDAKKTRYKRLWRERASLKPKNTVNRSYTSRYANTLEEFKRDFTLEAIEGNYVVSIARETELEELVRLLGQGDKGAVVLVGEPGVGKTTLIQSLALRMVVEDVPKKLSDMRLLGFDFNKAFAISGNVDSFRTVIEKIFEEVANAKNIILVIDDIDQLVNLRDEVSKEVVGIIIESVDRHNLRIIATSSGGGYDSYLKPQKALISLFDVIKINEPSDQVALQILIDEVPMIESKYGVSISVDSLRNTINLSHKFAFDRVMPEKALDLIEEAAAYSQEKGMKFVSEREIDLLVSKKVGVQVGALNDEEREKLTNIENIMHKRVVGQEKAVDAIAAALRRVRAGLASNKRPVASFLFFGPTGVGKTEVAKTLAESYFGDEKLMIRIDMSEYHEEENLKRLIGYQEGNDFLGGQLTEKVRERPFSLVLLDEIEKANPQVLDLFLQVLDEGSLTDGIGRKVDFTNTIIVATSNAASKKIAELIEQGNQYPRVYKEIIPELRNTFRVEFLNRFDGVIMFKPLSQEEVAKVAEIMLNNVRAGLYDKGIYFDFDPQVTLELAKIGYNPVYGARELRRVIQTQVEDKIADLIVKGDLKEGRKLVIKSLNNFHVIEK